MATDVLMPVITEEGAEAVVTAWMVEEGARVRTGQLIAEVQAEKVSADVEAPEDGVVVGLVPINHPVPQGAPICRIVEAAETGGQVGPMEAPGGPPTRERPAAARPASPAARRLAAELGVSLDDVEGSGPGGRITEADVRKAAESKGAPADEGVEMGALRAVIARNMRESRAATAPVTLTTTADVTDRVPEQTTAWLVKAAAVALADHPALNGVREGDVFHPARVTGISLAVQTDAGLVAPVVRDPGAKTLEELAEEIGSLAERARARKLDAADFQGGTFSVSNLGAYGIDWFTPIINLPQVAILGVGAIRTVPQIVDGQVRPRQRIALSLTFDHAFVDGAPAAAFLARLREVLETERL